MPKMKIHRKSTSIDMTAMCDVAFLLLSFFIFTAKFKKSAEVEITTPTSVSTDSLGTKNKFNVTCNIATDGSVLMDLEVLGLKTDSLMYEYAKLLNSTKQLGLTDAEMKAFGTKTAIGLPFKDLKGYLNGVATAQQGLKQTGIPVIDSSTAELGAWIDATKFIYQNLEIQNKANEYNIFIKGDNKTPYDVVDKVMLTWVDKGFDQFKMVTTPKDAPVGTEYYKKLKAERNETSK